MLSSKPSELRGRLRAAGEGVVDGMRARGGTEASLWRGALCSPASAHRLPLGPCWSRRAASTWLHRLPRWLLLGHRQPGWGQQRNLEHCKMRMDEHGIRRVPPPGRLGPLRQSHGACHQLQERLQSAAAARSWSEGCEARLSPARVPYLLWRRNRLPRGLGHRRCIAAAGLVIVGARRHVESSDATRSNLQARKL